MLLLHPGHEEENRLNGLKNKDEVILSLGLIN
jgi:hypothetical protein